MERRLPVLGVAGDVVLFVDFAQKLIARTLRLYKAADGTRNIDVPLRDFPLLKATYIRDGQGTQAGKFEVELNAKGLDATIQRLVGYAHVLAAHGGELGELGVGAKSAAHAVAEECCRVANDLLACIERFKSQNPHRSWKNLRAALGDLWKEPELVEIQRKLETIKIQIERQALISLRESPEFSMSRHLDQFDAKPSSMHDELFYCLQRAQLNPESAPAPQSPVTEEDVHSRDSHDLMLAQVAKSILDALEARGLGKVPAVTLIDPAITSDLALRLARRLRTAEWDLVESLRFSVLTDRQRTIPDAERATFDWIYREPRSTDLPWDNFSDWLLRGNALYWIKGKAGSGKSTLMKHLFWQTRTLQLLRVWASGTPLVAAGFFFWDNGNHFQKTQEGLLRSLLQQCLASHRELIPIVFPDLARTNSKELESMWTLDRLGKAFARLIEQDQVPIKICFFIDGVDEYSGDHEAIATIIKEIGRNPNIKACISSRKLEVFEEAFQGSSGLLLQNLTSEDIKEYVRSKLAENPAICASREADPDLESRLSATIVEKASGVFLWVRFVVQTLLERASEHENGLTLEQRIRDLPEDLEDLYWDALTSVKSTLSAEQASRILQIGLAARKPLTILQLSYALEDPQIAIQAECNHYSAKDRQTMSSLTQERLLTDVNGLLEISSSTSTDPIHYQAVQFTHKSVADFLATPKVRQHLTGVLQAQKQPFSPNIALMRACILELKHLNTAFYPERQPGAILAQMWFGTALPIIGRFIEYAQRAEQETQDPQLPLIAELDRIAKHLCSLYVQSEGRYNISTSLISPRLHWSERTQEGMEIDPVQENGSVFSFAVKAGLTRYILAALGREKHPGKVSRPNNSQIKYALLLCDVLASDPDWLSNETSRQQIRSEMLKARGFRISAFAKPALRRFSFGVRSADKLGKSQKQQRRSAVMSAHLFPGDEKQDAQLALEEADNDENSFELQDMRGTRQRSQSFKFTALADRPPTPRFTLTVLEHEEHDEDGESTRSDY